MYEFLRNDIIRGVAREYRVRESGVAGAVEVRPGPLERRGDREEAIFRIRAYDAGAPAWMRQMFELDWADPLLYDLVINTEAVSLESGVRQVRELRAAPEFQPTPASRVSLGERALAVRVRAVLRVTAATARVEVEIRANEGRLQLGGVVLSEEERDAALAVAPAVLGVVEVRSHVEVFRKPVR